MAYCSQCGQPLREGSSFCTNCGAHISTERNKPEPVVPHSDEIKSVPDVATQNVNKPAPQQPSSPNAPAKGSSGMFKWIMIALSVVLAAGLIVMWTMYSSKTNELNAANVQLDDANSEIDRLERELATEKPI